MAMPDNPERINRTDPLERAMGSTPAEKPASASVHTASKGVPPSEKLPGQWRKV